MGDRSWGASRSLRPPAQTRSAFVSWGSRPPNVGASTGKAHCAVNATQSCDLTRECHRVISGLDIADPFDLQQFVHVVAERRGKPIALVPAQLGATAPCGMLVGTDAIDYICYASNTSALHARHIVVHELGHLLFGQRGDAIEPVSIAGQPTAGRTSPTTKCRSLRSCPRSPSRSSPWAPR